MYGLEVPTSEVGGVERVNKCAAEEVVSHRRNAGVYSLYSHQLLLRVQTPGSDTAGDNSARGSQCLIGPRRVTLALMNRAGSFRAFAIMSSHK